MKENKIYKDKELKKNRELIKRNEHLASRLKRAEAQLSRSQPKTFVIEESIEKDHQSR